MKSLYYICAQPATLYYAWQVEVMINNFMKNEVLSERVHIVCATKENHIPDEWNKLQQRFPSIKFFFYNDTRITKLYVSSIRPNILKQHFIQHSYLKNHAIFYHDCDMVLTQPVSWEQFVQDDIWYLSNTVGYIGAEYIKSKKYGVYERMCEIIDIDEQIPVDNEMNSGGAQYIMKNVDEHFWEKVEKDSETLFEFFLHHSRAFPQSPKYHPIQMWTADMWAVLWNAWYFKHITRVVPELDFAWPGHRTKDWETKFIYHNAGVVEVSDTERLFHKNSFMYTLPYNNIDIEWLKKDRCSYKYVQEIVETAQHSCLL